MAASAPTVPPPTNAGSHGPRAAGTSAAGNRHHGAGRGSDAAAVSAMTVARRAGRCQSSPQTHPVPEEPEQAVAGEGAAPVGDGAEWRGRGRCDRGRGEDASDLPGRRVAYGGDRACLSARDLPAPPGGTRAEPW